MGNGNKVKVVLADRDRIYRENLKTYLEQEGNILVVGMVDTGAKTLDIMKKTGADVLIMDVLLGNCDGLWVLEEMFRTGVKIDVCVMVSAIDSDRVVHKAMKLGADYFMAKPVKPDILLERIKQLYMDKQGTKMHHEKFATSLGLSPSINLENITSISKLAFDSLEGEVSNVLNRMGVPASIKGYHYIRKAVLMAVENEESLIGITKGLYPDIAKFYDTTSSKVERAIRHAIESSWKRNGESVFTECSGYHPQGKPTNGQFIAAFSEYFRLLKNVKFSNHVS